MWLSYNLILSLLLHSHQVCLDTHLSYRFIPVSWRGTHMGAKFPVAETFMNNVPNGASRNIKPYFQLSNTHTCLLELLRQYPEQDQQTWTAEPLICSSITFTRPLSNSLHHLRTRCTVITLAPHTVTSSRWTFFAHKKKRMTNAILLLSTLSVRSPSWNYCCVCSRQMKWWLLLISVGEYIY
jgi:hypothetical protein